LFIEDVAECRRWFLLDATAEASQVLFFMKQGLNIMTILQIAADAGKRERQKLFQTTGF